MDLVPQLWDLASLFAPDLEHDPDEVADVAAAEHARVALADRLRGSAGSPVRARLLIGTPVSGTVAAVFADGIVVTEPAATWVLPLAGVARLDVAARPPVPATGRERGSVLGAVRELVPGEVVVATADAAISRLRLAAVGADHLVATPAPTGDVALLPWSAVAWLRA